MNENGHLFLLYISGSPSSFISPHLSVQKQEVMHIRKHAGSGDLILWGQVTQSPPLPSVLR